MHIVEDNSFTSNITNRTYYVRSPLNDSVLDCGSRNVIYLISCGKCGLQYVGKTSQTLRSQLNNHHNRLKQLCDLYLYNHRWTQYYRLEYHAHSGSSANCR